MNLPVCGQVVLGRISSITKYTHLSRGVRRPRRTEARCVSSLATLSILSCYFDMRHIIWVVVIALAFGACKRAGTVPRLRVDSNTTPKPISLDSAKYQNFCEALGRSDMREYYVVITVRNART